MFSLALEAHRRGDLAEAERLYRQVLAAEPGHAYALTNLGTVLLQQGDQDAPLGLYALAIAADPSCALAHYNRGNLLLERGLPAEALLDFDAVVALNPGHADAFCNQGVALKALDRTQDALAAYDAALAVNPAHLHALANRAVILVELKRWDEALEGYRQAVALAPDVAEYTLQYGGLLLRKGRHEEALAALNRAIALGSNSIEAYHCRASALEATGRYDEARRALDQVLAAKPDHAEAQTLKGMLAILHGDYASGWALHEARWLTHESDPMRRLGKPQWSIHAPTQGQTIMLHAEQGFGDTLQMLRYVPVLAGLGARVLLTVPPTLSGIARTIEGQQGVWLFGQPLPPFDQHCPMMSLPFAFETREDTVPRGIPYIRAEPSRVSAWTERLPPDGRRRVGLVWSGNADHLNDRNRSLPLEALTPLLDLDARFISLQVAYRDADRALLDAGLPIADVAGALASLDETAALIETLDLVITVDTAVAHLAGAMGKPVWLMLAYKPDFRWGLKREDTPWYPSARLLRQPRAGDWAAVVAEASKRLRAL